MNNEKYKYCINFAFLPIETWDLKKIWFERYITKYILHIRRGKNKWTKVGSWSRYSDEWKNIYINFMSDKK